MSNEESKSVVRQVFTEYLVSHSLRKTPERFAILDEIYSRDGHFDIESLFNYMREKNYRVSRATLYNTIDLLLDSKLVTRHKFGHNQAQYEKAFQSGQHDHFIDTDTGRIYEFKDQRIGEIIKTACQDNEFVPNHYLLYVYGKAGSGR